SFPTDENTCWSVREWVMFVHNAADASSRLHSLRDLGMKTDSNPIISLNEFTYKKGAELYGEKEPAEYVYQVKSGAVRSYKLLSDGRRQIGAFRLAADTFGLENGDQPRFPAEPIVDTSVRLNSRQTLQRVRERG